MTADPYTTGRYAAENPDWHDSDGAHKAVAVARLVRDLGLAPRDVVDVGCGSGAVLRALVPALADVLPATRWEGVDPAPAAIARARAAAPAGVAFSVGNFAAGDRTADLVLCLDVVEHVADELAFLEALRRRARRVILRLPLELSVLDLVRPARLLGARRRFGHRHAWTRTLALDLLAAAGFSVEAERYDRVPAPVDTARRRFAERARARAAAAAPHAAALWLGGFSLLVSAVPTDRPSGCA